MSERDSRVGDILDAISCNEEYAYDNDIFCIHHLDYFACGSCRIPDFLGLEPTDE